MDTHPSDIAVAHQLALPRMQSRPDRNPKLMYGVPNRTRASDCPRRAVECRQETVPCRLHLATPVSQQLPSDDFVVFHEKALPPFVPKLVDLLGGGDDVGQEDRSQEAVGWSG